MSHGSSFVLSEIEDFFGCDSGCEETDGGLCDAATEEKHAACRSAEHSYISTLPRAGRTSVSAAIGGAVNTRSMATMMSNSIDHPIQPRTAVLHLGSSSTPFSLRAHKNNGSLIRGGRDHQGDTLSLGRASALITAAAVLPTSIETSRSSTCARTRTPRDRPLSASGALQTSAAQPASHGGQASHAVSWCYASPEAWQRPGVPERRNDGLLSSIMDSNGQQSTCAICLDVMCLGQMVSSLPCEHSFHESCMVRWLHKSLQCPLCKRSLARRIFAVTPDFRAWA